jgi:hypothetical protein
MDSVLLNTVLMRIAVFIFGLAFYLALVVVVCSHQRGEPTHSPRLSTRWQIVVFALCGTLFVTVPWLPQRDYPGPGDVAIGRPALLLVVVASLACIGYAGWAAREVSKTVAWMRAGRPRRVKSARWNGHPRLARPLRVAARPYGSGPAPTRQVAIARRHGRHGKRGRHAGGQARTGKGFNR